MSCCLTRSEVGDMAIEGGDRNLELFAACPRNVAELLASELKAIGADVLREHPAGVAFRGGIREAYAACLHSRCASRVILTLAEIPAESADALYAAVRALPWEQHLAAQGSLAVDVVGEPPHWLRHTRFAAQLAKDAIVDRFRDRTGTRPSVDLADPDLRVSLRLGRDRASIGLDLSGEPLHRRGYRQSGVEAPLKENLAAALLLRSGWPEMAEAGGAFVDPMCGSGTLVIEAALMAARIAPGLLRRRFGFERWLQHDRGLWQELLERARSQQRLERLEPGRLRGYDRDQSAIRAAIANANRAGLGDHLVFERRELANLVPAASTSGLVLVNPPYGARLGDVDALRPVYEQLGRQLMGCYPGWEAAVFTGEPSLGRSLGLRAYRSHTFFNGPIECRLLRLHLDAKAVEPDRETVRRERLELARARPGAAMFANRLRKNLARLERWARREGVHCYRVYDADMPEYSFAIDLYGNGSRHAYVQEYEAPATVSREAARGRRDEALSVLPEVLGIAPESIHLRVRRRQKQGAQYERLAESGQFHEVREGPYRFLVNFTDYLDTGLFLDHRLTRGLVGAHAAGKSFLNLFAYTGAATVHAVGGGATASTTIDMSRTYLDWARRNLALNDLVGPQHGFLQEDCIAWLEQQAAAPQRRYGLIFLDPPTFSRSKRMSDAFDVQRDHVRLLQQAGSLLEPDGLLIFSCNLQRFRLDRDALGAFRIEDVTRATIPPDFARNPRIHCCFLLRPGP